MIAVALALVAGVDPTITPPRTFGDWYVGCDNSGRCGAIALVPETAAAAEPPFWTLSIWRGDRSDASTIYLGKDFDIPGPTTLRADGQPTGLSFGKTGEVTAGQPGPATKIIAGAHALDVVNASGKVIAHVSPNGAAAALLWMDEKQAHAGNKSLPTIATPPRPATAAAKLTRQQMEGVRKGHDCDAFADLPDSWSPEFDRLDATTTLGIIPCSLGAYQGDAVMVLIDDKRHVRLTKFAPVLPGSGASEDGSPSEMMVDPEFDSKRGILWSNVQDRGLGDCGETVGYAWDGHQFRLAYAAVMTTCRGSLERVPLWRTTNAPAPPQ